MVRVAKLALPAPDFDAAPLVCLPINVDWLPVLLSAIARLELKASWVDGTDSDRADQQILALTLAIKNAMECGDMPFDVRQKPGAPCELEKSTDDGATWATWANLRLCPPLLRIGAAGAPEISTDGGTTYTPIQTAPPPVRGTPPAGQDNRCLAAANAVNVLVSFHYEIARTYAPGIPVLVLATAVVAVILSMLGLFIAAGAITGMMTALLLYAASLVNDAFTAAIQEELKCILFCAGSETGGAVTFDLAAVNAEIAAKYPSDDMWRVLSLYLQIIGADGLNRAGATTAITSATCNCLECEWCYTFDFTQSDGGWLDFGDRCIYSLGNGWIRKSGAISTGMVIQRLFPSSSIITSVYSEWVGDIGGLRQHSIRVNSMNDLSNFASGISSPRTVAFSNITANSIFLVVDAVYSEANIIFRRVTIRGTGVNPFGSDNC